MYRKQFSILTLLLTTFTVHFLTAQMLEVSTGHPFTPEDLVRNVFLGDGVDVLNVEYYGNNSSIGVFNGGDTLVGLQRGLVMTTGLVNTISQPASTAASDINNSDVRSPYLNQISRSSMLNDVSRLVITFIPFSDTLQFRYVFASDEYPTYVCSEFNDVFGFFITGPGINGDLLNGAKNIALVPGTNLPVAINSINSGRSNHPDAGRHCVPPYGSLDYSEYYVDRLNSRFLPVFNGLTTALTAEAIVTPCETYTIVLSIGDVSDKVIDSGVFLEAKSFGTGTLAVKPVTLALDGTVAESCDEGFITFELPKPVSRDYDLEFDIFGTAQNGLDYEPIPDELTIPAGDSQLLLPIRAIADGLDEGTETLNMSVRINSCNLDTLELFIRDNPLSPSSLLDSLEICSGLEHRLDATLPVPLPGVSTFYSSSSVNISTHDTTYNSTIQVSNVYPVSLQEGVIKSVCIDAFYHRWIDDMSFYLVSPSGKFLELSTNNGSNGGNGGGMDSIINMCFVPTASTHIAQPGELAPPDLLPFTGEWLPEGIFSDLWDGGNNPTNGDWSLVMVDRSMGFTGMLESWQISFEPTYDISYLWTPSDGLNCTDCSDPVLTAQVSGHYEVLATDSYGCSLKDSSYIKVTNGLPAPEIECSLQDTTSITVSWPAISGAAYYEVRIDSGHWSPSQEFDEHTFSNLSRDQSYIIEIRAAEVSNLGDCKGAIGIVLCRTLSCNSPELISDFTPPSCHGASDGLLDLSGSFGGAGGPYSYYVEADTNFIGTFNGIAAGRHEIGVVDVAGCPSSQLLIVEAPAYLQVTLEEESSIGCHGGVGNITTSITGGTAPYELQWSDGNRQMVRNNLFSGLYFITITDDRGCTAQDSLLLREPSLLTYTWETVSPSCKESTDGNLRINLQGGTPPYSYSWTDLNDTTHLAFRDNLSEGTYRVIITDAAGCMLSADTSLVAPPKLQGQLLTTETRCDRPTGRITAVVEGGVPSYQFLWNDGSASTDSIISSLDPQMYSVEVTDAVGCTLILSATIDTPSLPIVQLIGQGPSCLNNDGRINAAASGGNGSYNYQWNNGTIVGDEEITGLTSGLYHILLTDELGCTASDTIQLTEADSLQLRVEVTAPLCAGNTTGRLEASTTGGLAPYTYVWNTGFEGDVLNNVMAGTYQVTVTDAQGCSTSTQILLSDATHLRMTLLAEPVSCAGLNDASIQANIYGGIAPYQYSWEDGSSDSERMNLSGGDFHLTVTDARGCIQTDSITIVEPKPLSVSASSKDITCYGNRDGSIVIRPTGGTPPYEYKILGFQSGSSNIFSGLAAGTYTAALTDANGCTTLSQPIILVQPDLLTIDLGGNLTAAYGELIYLDPIISGGTPAYSYQWQVRDSASLSCLDCPNPVFSPSGQESLELTVSDALGCMAKDIITVFITKTRVVAVPTGFTPNGDGHNDRLVVHGQQDAHVDELHIYNRWGEQVYSRKDFSINQPDLGWDGYFRDKPAPPGVYVWTALVTFSDGQQFSFNGQTTLIR